MKHLDIIHHKIFSPEEMVLQIERWHFKSKKVAFTNGCFDLLHLGHIDYLAKAADEADFLIIGVNTDHSVQRLKGPHRPINNEEQRSMILASLHFVAGVVIFDEDTPLSLITKLKPDVLIKGADYAIENIVGGDVVTAYGGRVMTIDFLQGYSTTSIESRIKGEK